jgi:hypothetical protein
MHKPSTVLSRVLSTRKKLTKILIPTYVGLPLTGDVFDKMVLRVASVFMKHAAHELPGGEIKGQQTVITAVRHSLEAFFLNQTASLSSMRDVIDILAGNLRALPAGIPVRPWSYQTEPEWVEVVVTEATTALTTMDRTVKLHLHVITGRPAGKDIVWSIREPSCLSLMIKIGGLSRKTPRFINCRELVRLYFLARVKEGPDLAIDNIDIAPGLAARNKRRVGLRSDFKSSCPINSKYPCHFCHVGYVSCGRGTHKHAWPEKPCRNGHSSYIVSGYTPALCRDCELKHWRASHG